MRITSLIFAVLGALAAGALGAIWFGDLSEAKETLAALEAAGADTGAIAKLQWATYLLLLSSVLGIVGGVLAFKGKGRVAAGILAVAAVAPVVFAPIAAVATGFLFLSAIFAFFAKPKQEASFSPGAMPVPA